jgi:hypothetical protein
MAQPVAIGPDGEAFVGKRLLVGIRWTSKSEFVREEQFHGLIVEADQQGVCWNAPTPDSGSFSRDRSKRLRVVITGFAQQERL